MIDCLLPHARAVCGLVASLCGRVREYLPSEIWSASAVWSLTLKCSLQTLLSSPVRAHLSSSYSFCADQTVLVLCRLVPACLISVAAAPVQYARGTEYPSVLSDRPALFTQARCPTSAPNPSTLQYDFALVDTGHSHTLAPPTLAPQTDQSPAQIDTHTHQHTNTPKPVGHLTRTLA